jgi:hypothetical protein
MRLAFDPGRGKTAVPVRSAFFGAIAGIVGLTAVLVFASSLRHLDATPRLYGWTWDFTAPDNSSSSTCGAQGLGVDRVAGVGAVAGVCFQAVQVDDRPTTGWGFTPIRGALEPAIVRGRAPATADEVALGAGTLHALGKEIGDTVAVRTIKGASLPYRVVGQVALPRIQDGDVQALDDGAAFTGAGYAPLLDPNNYTRYVIGKYATGANPSIVNQRIDTLPDVHVPSAVLAYVTVNGVAGITDPPEIDRLRAVDWFPAALAALLAVLALAAVGHAVVSAVRRRRREFALLKTLGFERRQVRATVAWQATTLAVVGLLFGIPGGVLLGAFVWRHVTGSIGIADVTVIPVRALVLAIPVVVVIVNLVAFWPARAAARRWPAAALAAE